MTVRGASSGRSPVICKDCNCTNMTDVRKQMKHFAVYNAESWLTVTKDRKLIAAR